MCGIAGIVGANNKERMTAQLQSMAHTLRHRGPNGESFWLNQTNTVGFAHRRLSIIDLSDASNQPLHYLHYTLVFNGEIYNYEELKKTLTEHGYVFTTNGDAEVIPAAYDYWGSQFLQQLDGMFAFALYDGKQNTVLLARDRFGEKPLYYTQYTSPQHPKTLVFASEIKALFSAGVDRSIHHTMMLNFLTLGYTQNPVDKSETFFKNIYSLPPGHFITYDVNKEQLSIHEWYKPSVQSLKYRFKAQSEQDVIDRFSELLRTSIQRRLRSDVPVGTSLSGGLDSSSIVALIHQLQQKNTLSSQWKNVSFSAIFPGFEKDESRYAKQVATQFGIQQFEVLPTANDLVDNWENLVYHQDEPFQSSSIFTQYCVYQQAQRQGITVLLDGQGADEVLGGYKKYSHWHLQHLLLANPVNFLREKKLLELHHLVEQWSVKNYAAAFMPAQTANALHNKAVQLQKQHPHIQQDYLTTFQSLATLQKPTIKSLDDILHYNTFDFGLEELLRYADRNSMAHSREVRLPFLFHELVEFVFALPAHYKIRNGFTKWILRQAMHTNLSEDIVWRTDKVGFEPPQKQWMQQKALQEMVVISRKKLCDNGILHTSVMNASLEPKSAHDGNNYDWRYLSAAAIL